MRSRVENNKNISLKNNKVIETISYELEPVI